MTMFSTLNNHSSEGEGARAADLLGHLLLIEPTEYIANMTTSMGETDAVACRVVDLDTGTDYPSTLFFNVALKNALKNRVGQRILARMAQAQAKPGKSGAYILEDATADAAAVKKGTDYLTGAAAATLSAPAPAAAPATGLDLSDPAIAALVAQLGAKPVA